jgi:hypothetical protein
MREYDVMFILSSVQICEMFRNLKWRTQRKSHDRQHSNSFFDFANREIGLIVKIIQFANILLTGNSNNAVFAQFPIMNKMRA